MAESFDYDYDTGSFGKNPVQVTRYRQNIQRFRDYGNVGQVNAPVAEGRFKEGIQPSSYRFEPPSAGVTADFYRDSRMRDPNQPPLDISAITNLQYNRMFFEKDGGTKTTTDAGTPSRRATTRTSTPEGVATTKRGLFGFGRKKTEVQPFTPQQVTAIRGTQEARAQRVNAAPASQQQRTPARRPIKPNPIQRVQPSTTTEKRELTPLQQRAIEAIRQRKGAVQQPVTQQSAVQQTPPAAKSSGSRAKKRPSKSGIGKVGRSILDQTLPEARGYLNL